MYCSVLIWYDVGYLVIYTVLFVSGMMSVTSLNVK